MLRRLAIGLALILLPLPAAAEDKALLARFFDGMRVADYDQAVTAFLPLMLSERQPGTDAGRGCISALRATDVAAADKACAAFADDSPDEPMAPLSLGLAKLLANDTDGASRLFFKAAKMTPPFHPALFMTTFGQPNSSLGMTALDRISIPPGEEATFSLAVTSFKQGDFDAAARSFQRIYDADATTGSVPLMLFIAQKRAGKKPTIDLVSDADGDADYHMLAQAIRGDKTPKDAFSEFSLRRGESQADYARNRFFLGQAALLQGDKAGAMRYFKKVVAAKQAGQMESDLAAAELKRLEQE